MARLAALLLAFAVAVSAAALAHGRDLPTQIKLTKGGGAVGGDSQECVYTWLATDAAPYKLEAVVDRCPADGAAAEE
uniref:Uncharacterized protein n=1 Tax=Aegilops tauschii TaxID=37682 RepID=M8C114_AEGTA